LLIGLVGASAAHLQTKANDLIVNDRQASGAGGGQAARGSASPPSGQGTRVADRQGDVVRGRYLVEEVAKCPECHTPRDQDGQLDSSRWLQGAPTWIMPVRPTSNWAYEAPALAGLPSYTDEDGQNVLEKGQGPHGETLRPPMHIYHMSHEDAVAVIAYLRSLPSAGR
jgi:mono/diheme cytochrome c family protein